MAGRSRRQPGLCARGGGAVRRAERRVRSEGGGRAERAERRREGERKRKEEKKKENGRKKKKRKGERERNERSPAGFAAAAVTRSATRNVACACRQGYRKRSGVGKRTF